LKNNLSVTKSLNLRFCGSFDFALSIPDYKTSTIRRMMNEELVRMLWTDFRLFIRICIKDEKKPRALSFSARRISAQILTENLPSTNQSLYLYINQPGFKLGKMITCVRQSCCREEYSGGGIWTHFTDSNIFIYS
jgi:hypothetical protein